MRYIVYTEIHTEDGFERWFYDLCESRAEANEVAYAAGGEWPRYHCICPAAEAERYEVRNLPLGLC